MVKGKGLGIILAVGLIALLLSTACAPAPPAEEKKVVEIGVIAMLTGPASTTCQYGLRNAVDYLRYFEEIGIPGVTLPPGVTIKLIWADCGAEVGRGIGAYQRFIERGVVLLNMYNPASAEALKPRCEKDEVPVISMAATDALMYPPGWIYAFYPTESERFAAVCDWIMENWEEERPPRVGMMGADTPWGRAAEVMGTKYAKSIGIEMLPFEVVPYMPLDVTPQLLRLHERRVDYVYIHSIVSAAGPIMRDADRLGLTEEIRFGGHELTQTIGLIEALGPAAEGYFASRAAPWYKEVPFLIDIYVRYRGKIDTEGEGAATLLYMPVMIEAIRRAIDNVGYENVDGRAAKEALDSIEDFDPHHIGRPVTYTPEDHRGAPVLRIYEVQGGEVVPVTDWRDAHMLVPEK
jgi:branched-chain amino acid transport system substrate-binding protein